MKAGALLSVLLAASYLVACGDGKEPGVGSESGSGSGAQSSAGKPGGGTSAGDLGMGGSAGSGASAGGAAGLNQGVAGNGGTVSPSVMRDVIGVGTRLCAINQARDLVCWEGAVVTRPGPFAAVSVTESAICTLLASGEASCNGAGEPPAGETFIAVRTMRTRACGQRADKTLICWGEDTDGNVSDVTKAPVDEFSTSLVTCAVTHGAAPSCWGPTELVTAPALELVNITATPSFTCGVALDGSIHCWGQEPYDPDGGGFLKAQMVKSTGGSWGCALNDAKKLFCWGKEPSVKAERDALDFSDFAISKDAVCGVLEDRSVRCWGASAPPADLRVF